MHGETCRCNEEPNDIERGGTWLYTHISSVEWFGLETTDEKILRDVLMRDHSQRFSTENAVVSLDGASDDDCSDDEYTSEVLLSIHFTNPVKLHSIVVLSPDGNSVPDKMRLFSERPHLDLGIAKDTLPVQELAVVYDPCGVMEHPVKTAKFNDITSLQMHFMKKTGPISIQYIGIKGEATKHQRKPVTTVYESKPNLSDHQIQNVNSGRMDL